MSFVSLAFLLLFIVSYSACRLCKTRAQKHTVLLIASFVFYAYWDARFLLLLVLQTYISYILARKMERSATKRQAKRFMILGVSISLAILGFFKYFNFFIESFAQLFGIQSLGALNIILPVGISFYTFQALSYLIDVYKGKLKACDHFASISLYISFFPQLVAGPIVRASDFLPQLNEDRPMTRANLAEGFQIFLFGLIKKIVIADRLAVCVDAVFASPLSYSGFSILLAVIAYSMQIYCDFSGYSDMAIGVAKAFGYDLCKNFDMPYLSKNPSEFWQRWHISLSTWLRDYLYIPLGGNRKGKIRTKINLMFTMLLGGLWHGANWQMVFWGALHGGALIVHKTFREQSDLHGKHIQNGMLKQVVSAISVVGMYLFTCLCWIFFRATSFSDAITIITRIASGAAGIRYHYVFTFVFAGIIAIASAIGYNRNQGHGFYPLLDLSRFWSKVALIFAIILMLMFFYAGDTAFIYFQF
ncbi:MAG: MBOAT family protein [Eubacteriales bacterium]|jgi:alginate O-acetyltransferase complex protein AlgI|nr:MBOAT family protein [Eubacteriales bacterium]